MKNKLFLGFIFSSALACAFLILPSKNAVAQSTCTIGSFSADATSVRSGESAFFSWQTYGCTSALFSDGTTSVAAPLTLTGGEVGPLFYTTTFTLYANGATSASRSITINVSGSGSTYLYACSDGIDNDGDGWIDYPNDPGCSGTSDNDETDSGTFSFSVTTTPATNVGIETARLHGLVSESDYPIAASFEYGTTPALGFETVSQNLSSGQTGNRHFYDTIVTSPGTTYYYRAVAQTNDTLVRGSIASFTTPRSDSPTAGVTYVSGSSSGNSGDSLLYAGSTSGGTGSTKGSSAIQQASDVSVSVEASTDKASSGDLVSYTVKYANNTKSKLSGAQLSIALPQGFSVRQTTQGQMIGTNTVMIDLGTIAPGQAGSVFVEAIVANTVHAGEALVTTATLTFTLPSGAHDSAVGYAINHATSSSASGGLAIGSGFFPATIFGWLMTILIILALVLIARRIARARHANGHAAGGGHH